MLKQTSYTEIMHPRFMLGIYPIKGTIQYNSKFNYYSQSPIILDIEKTRFMADGRIYFYYDSELMGRPLTQEEVSEQSWVINNDPNAIVKIQLN